MRRRSKTRQRSELGKRKTNGVNQTEPTKRSQTKTAQSQTTAQRHNGTAAQRHRLRVSYKTTNHNNTTTHTASSCRRPAVDPERRHYKISQDTSDSYIATPEQQKSDAGGSAHWQGWKLVEPKRTQVWPLTHWRRPARIWTPLLRSKVFRISFRMARNVDVCAVVLGRHVGQETLREHVCH